MHKFAFLLPRDRTGEEGNSRRRAAARPWALAPWCMAMPGE
jgi:hypothetical protein